METAYSSRTGNVMHTMAMHLVTFDPGPRHALVQKVWPFAQFIGFYTHWVDDNSHCPARAWPLRVRNDVVHA